jgi:hypothetical protein
VWTGAALCGMVLLVLAAAIWPPALKAAIQVQTDRNPVSVNESFQITFSAKGGVDGAPDFSPLRKDFQILSTNQSSNFSIINGKIERSKSWTITVLPRHTGKLAIPPIHFGSDLSPAANETVTGAASQPDQQSSDADIFLEAEVSTTHPYVQAQVIYTLRLYRAVPTANASLDEPKVEKGDAVIEHLNADKHYQTRVNGKSYLVVQRKYAVYPQSSGTVTLSPVKFEGQVAPNSFSLMDPFGPAPKTVVRQSAQVTLNVKGIPAGFKGSQWVPAKQVSLKEEWSRDPPTFKVGQPITRTLILTADGQTSSQLPELPHWVPDGLKAYPDQPALKDDKNRNGIIGSRVEKTALIPEKPGDYVLPAISVPWWNVATGKMEHATLPERHITVAAAAGSGSGAGQGGLGNVKPAPLGKLNGPVQPPAKQSTSAPPSPNPAPEAGGGYNPWLLLSLALVGVWLITVLAWWWSGRRRRNKARDAGQGADSLRRLRRELRAACLGHSPARVKELTLAWGRLYWSEDPPASLGEIGRRTHPALADEIRRLNRALYSRNGDEWQGEVFWQAFEHSLQQNSKSGDGDQGRLEPLYLI